MKHSTLYVTVGRAAPRPVCTVSHDVADYEAQLAAHELAARIELVGGGNAQDRISFSRDTVEAAEESAQKPKKGKG